MSYRSSDQKIAVIVGGIILTVVVGTILLYGTIAAIIIHFVHKFW